ncbi:MAG: DUF998 domain-containing protein [Nitrososphaerota archaeon]|nr:DUF998 domain-containing protein [Nitrososphaerota archaeon]MDG7023451.1 DUF998 domain-containing protein [Nitrososphaerota archaeon]
MRSLKALGFFSALAAYPFILASVALSPWFNIYDNALSDLGNFVTNGQVAYVYDAGLVVSGGLILVFAVLYSRESRDRRALVWTSPLAVAATDLALVGVFPESTGHIHGVVSEIFFLMIVVTMLAYSYVSWPLGSPRVGAVALVFGILSAIIWFVTWPWPGVAIQESTTSGMTAVWLLLVASRIT